MGTQRRALAVGDKVTVRGHRGEIVKVSTLYGTARESFRIAPANGADQYQAGDWEVVRAGKPEAIIDAIAVGEWDSVRLADGRRFNVSHEDDWSWEICWMDRDGIMCEGQLSVSPVTSGAAVLAIIDGWTAAVNVDAGL